MKSTISFTLLVESNVGHLFDAEWKTVRGRMVITLENEQRWLYGDNARFGLTRISIDGKYGGTAEFIDIVLKVFD